jgi:hypothetical protein
MSSEGNEAPRLVPVMRGDTCAGFLISLGPRGVEAFDKDEKSLGVFPDANSAATAVEKSVAPPDNVNSLHRAPGGSKIGGGVMRERLPNRRVAETFEVEINGLRYTATVGRFADGRIGEIFVQNSKPGSTSDCYMRDAGISASLALQYGCPLETLRRALLRDPRGVPSTPIGCALDLLAGLDDA